MNALKLSIAALASAVTLSSAAQAADLIISTPSVAPPLATSYDWTGFYAGIFGGYIGGRTEATAIPGGQQTDIDLGGGLLGVAVGVNGQFDNFVLGLEGDIAWSGGSGSAACAGGGGFTCDAKIEWLSSVKVRAGVAVDRVLLFGTAGVAAGGVRASASPAPGGAFSTTAGGWTVGLGAEAAVTDTVSVKAEYAYYDLGTVQAGAGTIAPANAVDLKNRAHTFKVGLNVHF